MRYLHPGYWLPLGGSHYFDGPGARFYFRLRAILGG